MVTFRTPSENSVSGTVRSALEASSINLAFHRSLCVQSIIASPRHQRTHKMKRAHRGTASHTDSSAAWSALPAEDQPQLQGRSVRSVSLSLPPSCFFLFPSTFHHSCISIASLSRVSCLCVRFSCGDVCVCVCVCVLGKNLCPVFLVVCSWSSRAASSMNSSPVRCAWATIVRPTPSRSVCIHVCVVLSPLNVCISGTLCNYVPLFVASLVFLRSLSCVCVCVCVYVFMLPWACVYVCMYVCIWAVCKSCLFLAFQQKPACPRCEVSLRPFPYERVK
jgi:hypothetical protein